MLYSFLFRGLIKSINKCVNRKNIKATEKIKKCEFNKDGHLGAISFNDIYKLSSRRTIFLEEHVRLKGFNYVALG